jgi:hypothetical protein
MGLEVLRAASHMSRSQEGESELNLLAALRLIVDSCCGCTWRSVRCWHAAHGQLRHTMQERDAYSALWTGGGSWTGGVRL